MKLNLYQQVDILFSILEELLSSPFNKQFDDKAKHVLSKYDLEVVDGKIAKSQYRVSAESDDERIRKLLISGMKNLNHNAETFASIPIKDVIDWLEKQGEQKSNPVLDIEIPFGAKDSELQEATYLIPEGFHAEIKGDEVLIKKGKQKPAWSEEDENVLEDIEEAIINYWHGDTQDILLDWLKFLKDRYTWKPSEELDEASYHVGIKRVLDNPESYGLTKYNWKPSNEQLYFLHWLANNILTDGEVDKKASEILNTLYDDLKKL